MDQQRKLKIKAEMDNFLKANGWIKGANNSDDLAIQLAEPMFDHLVKCGLVSPQDWDAYYMAAFSQYQRAQFRKAGFSL